MKTKKRTIIIVIAAVLAAIFILPIVMLFSLNVFAWGVIGLGILLSPNPPAPQVKYGEFPFEITYEICGERYTVNDVYVCEYDGIEANEGIGKYRSWRGYIKGRGEDESSLVIYDDGERTIYCYVGDAEFYMNDEKYPKKRPLEPRVYSVLKSIPDVYVPDRFETNEEMINYYEIKIISWEFSEPIENSFKYGIFALSAKQNR